MVMTVAWIAARLHLRSWNYVNLPLRVPTR